MDRKDLAMRLARLHGRIFAQADITEWAERHDMPPSKSTVQTLREVAEELWATVQTLIRSEDDC